MISPLQVAEAPDASGAAEIQCKNGKAPRMSDAVPGGVGEGLRSDIGSAVASYSAAAGPLAASARRAYSCCMSTATSIGPDFDQGGNESHGNADGCGNKTLG